MWFLFVAPSLHRGLSHVRTPYKTRYVPGKGDMTSSCGRDGETGGLSGSGTGHRNGEYTVESLSWSPGETRVRVFAWETLHGHRDGTGASPTVPRRPVLHPLSHPGVHSERVVGLNLFPKVNRVLESTPSPLCQSCHSGHGRSTDDTPKEAHGSEAETVPCHLFQGALPGSDPGP